MQKQRLLVSVLVSVYNAEKYIEGRIKNLIGQSIFNKIEIIIINSGSPQNEEKIILPYLDKYLNIKYIRTPNRETIYKAWNRGAKIAEGEFIINANCDDRMFPNALQVLSNALIDNPQFGLVYCDQYIVNEVKDNYHQNDFIKRIKYPDFNELQHFERWMCSSMPMYRSKIHLEDNIWYDEQYEVAGDYEFQLNISRKYKFKHLNFVGGTFFKSKYEENKELQNKSLSVNESIFVKDKYLKIYVDNLSQIEINELLNKFVIYTKYPIILLKILKRIIKLISCNGYIPSIEFTYILVIRLYLRMNEIKNAEKLCKKYLNIYSDNRILNLMEEINGQN